MAVDKYNYIEQLDVTALILLKQQESYHLLLLHH